MNSAQVFLKNVNKLKERTFKISSNRKLFDKLFGKGYYNAKNGTYAYAVYTSNFKLIVGYQFKHKNGLGLNFKKELTSFINLYAPESYKDFLFFLDAYQMSGKPTFPCCKPWHPTMKELLSKKYTKHVVIDAILSESRGSLIWEYQLENLIKYFQDRGWDKIKEKIIGYYNYTFLNWDSKEEPQPGVIYWLRHGFSYQKPYYCNLLKKMKFNRKLSMFDVLKERMIKGFVHRPNVSRAEILFRTLK